MKDMTTPQRGCRSFAIASRRRTLSTRWPVLKKSQTRREAALKWLALAVLHGIDRRAKKICLREIRGRAC